MADRSRSTVKRMHGRRHWMVGMEELEARAVLSGVAPPLVHADDVGSTTFLTQTGTVRSGNPTVIGFTVSNPTVINVDVAGLASSDKFLVQALVTATRHKNKSPSRIHSLRQKGVRI